MARAMDEYIPEEKADERFFYATELVHHHDSGRWEIHVDPDACLTGEADDPAVAFSLADLTEEAPTVTRENGRTVYRGLIPFSAGVILLVGDEFVLLRRDADAPSDPRMWTSPAGRCDHTPGRTALVELYEELLVTADGRPVFVDLGGGEDLERVYAETLRRQDANAPTDEWRRPEVRIPEPFADLLVDVETHFGEETYVEEFWPFWDAGSSTLELRKLVRIDPPGRGDEYEFADGEWDRRVRTFDVEAYRSLDADDLVPTNAAFREHLGRLEG